MEATICLTTTFFVIVVFCFFSSRRQAAKTERAQPQETPTFSIFLRSRKS
jgi:hypothetical protein